MEWTPIIDGSNAAKYRRKLEEISHVLQMETPNLERMGLMGGKVGIALFFFYYAQLTAEEKYHDFAFRILSDVVDAMDGFYFNTFAKGQAGVGWVIEHLVENEFMEADTGDVLEYLDRFLYEKMAAELQTGNYDLLHGAVGYGVYFLNRLKKNKTNQYLQSFVNGLEKIAQKEKNGTVKWKTTINQQKGIIGVNLGLIHGTAGIIAALSKIYEQGIHKDKAWALLKGAVNYLLNQASDPRKSGFCFPVWIGDRMSPTGGGLSLSSGDLSIALALWQTSLAAQNDRWQEKSIDTALHTVKNTGLSENFIRDGALTIGTAGIAHAYNRMYHYTGRQPFKDSALYWFEETLKMANHPDGFAGFKAWRGIRVNRRDKEFGLVEGIAGIGLSLISALSAIEPKWDRSLLLS
jgi:lantibiotic modifying enzyme